MSTSHVTGNRMQTRSVTRDRVNIPNYPTSSSDSGNGYYRSPPCSPSSSGSGEDSHLSNSRDESSFDGLDLHRSNRDGSESEYIPDVFEEDEVDPEPEAELEVEKEAKVEVGFDSEALFIDTGLGIDHQRMLLDLTDEDESTNTTISPQVVHNPIQQATNSPLTHTNFIIKINETMAKYKAARQAQDTLVVEFSTNEKQIKAKTEIVTKYNTELNLAEKKTEELNIRHVDLTRIHADAQSLYADKFMELQELRMQLHTKAEELDKFEEVMGDHQSRITSITDLIKISEEHLVRYKRKADEIKSDIDKAEEAIRDYKRQKISLTLDQLIACASRGDIADFQAPSEPKQQQQQQSKVKEAFKICDICADVAATHVHAFNRDGTRGCGQWICEDCIIQNNIAKRGAGYCPYCRGEPPIELDGNSLWLKVATHQ